MNSVEVQGPQEPPKKKRRFFVDDSPTAEKSDFIDDLPPPTNGSVRSSDASLSRSHTEEQQLKSNRASISAPENGVDIRYEGPSGFDKETFETFVGTPIEASTLQRLREVSGDNMERAINMYLDGSWASAAISPQRHASSTIPDAFKRCPKSSVPKPVARDIERSRTLRKQETLQAMPEYRYVGAFGVGAWATRSGTGLVKLGESVNIERSKIKTAVKIGRGGKAIQLSKVSAARQRADIVVRFTNARGDEVGRLPRETAYWVSTLMDQKICRFDGTCFFAPDQIRVNDTLELQLRCSLLKSAFESSAFIKPQDANRTTGIFEENETSEEQSLRLRQVALVKLFNEINLHPTTANDTTAKHKREGILQAAEIAEQNDKDKDSKKISGTQDGTSTPPDEEQEEGKELEQDQLDSLYKKAQSFDFDTPVKEPAETFVMDLRKYQKQALHWMISKERDERSEKEVSMHPLWEDYTWPSKDMEGYELPIVSNQDHFYVNPYSGEMSLEFPIQEQHCLGGILADEMGLGKTIEMLSLMHTNRSDRAIQASDAGLSSIDDLPRLPKVSSSTVLAPCTTLVVAPMSLLAQWESEAAKASVTGSLKTLVYYGSDKVANLQNLCCEANAASAPNLIITSYGIILSEFNQVASRGGDRGSHGGLFSLDLFRIILDEAHLIKNRQSKTAKACYELKAQHRWVLTGTPIVNRLEDLFSLVHFLRVEPWANFSFWKTFITVPFESKEFIRALDVVQTVLEPLVMRRTKDMRTPDGEALVPLPPRIIDIQEIELSKQEREVYDYIYTRAKRAFNATMEAGTLLKSYTTIFAQILRLRQSCCHPVLTRNKAIVAEEDEAAAAADVANGLADDMDLQELIERFTSESGGSEQDIANKYGANVLQDIKSQEDKECPICSEEPMIEPAVTGCWHSACKKCLLDYIEHQKDKDTLPLCFNCREPINQRDIFEVVYHEDDEPSFDRPQGENHISLRRIGNNSSAKIAALVSHLKSLRIESPGTKTVVFSQFTSFLDLIAPALSTAKIPWLRFDGAMTQKARAQVLVNFSEAMPMKGGNGMVLLLSLRAGGVGLNLTAAKRVYMMDPWWSFAVEAQAIDRVHRMGQEEEVKVTRFIVGGSIEQRMLKVQERKKFIASSLGMMSEEEKKTQRIEDIKELLS
ncbi:uncharacterized protein KY384_004943 [Bacidia gigantensis]|uniref:uncharacterized protein n=1 Tax=Bacidia gigantensis TaxID=2732470 RepID=UPI001D04B53D|nr:uncharacterized protein KY384_004943 [Bacidia gigantensis]KAG8530441.1 hypothetical protein KY384_004943 [Bacidia gigantensis]